MRYFLQLLNRAQGLELREEAGTDGSAAGGAGAGNPGEGEPPAGEENKPNEGTPEAGSEESNKPSDELAKVLKDTMKWKSKARESETKISELSGELSTIKGAMGDLTIDDLTDLLKSRKDAERQELEAKGEYERIVEQMREENLKEVNEKNTLIDGLKQQVSALGGQIEDLTIGRAFSESTYITENSVIPKSLASKEFGEHFDFVDGQVIAYDKPRGKENRTPLVDASGNNKSFEAAIEQLYTAHPDAKALIRSKRKPGAGSVTTEDNATKPTPAKAYGLSRIKSGLETAD